MRPRLRRRRSWLAMGVVGLLTTGTVTLAGPAFAAACSPTVTIDGTATVVSFTATGSCTWTVPANVLSADVLEVAGGGGSAGSGGGGGAGGLVYQSGGSAVSLTPAASLTVLVGAGGTTNGGAGGNSSFGSVTPAVGGGGGGTAGNPGVAGGSGGGGGGTIGTTVGGAGTSGQGSAGAGGTTFVSGGGGGAGGVGGVSTTTNPGAGLANSITGTAVTYAVGGAASSGYAYSGVAAPGNNPSVGGGGRTGNFGATAAGNAGTVVVRYLTPTLPVLTAASAPATGTVGTAYAGYTYTASGVPTPTFSVASGALPAGLSLNSTTGALSGTPTGTGGVSTFTIAATNGVGSATSGTQTITVAAAPVFTAQAATTTATVGTGYSFTFTATGYPAPTFAVASGAVPAGLSLLSAGVLSGTPSAPGTSTFTVSATNATGTVSTSSRSIVVSPAAAAPVLTASSPPLTGTVGTAYAGYTFTASGYPAPTFAVASGTLPAGLALDSFTGGLSGTPTAAGTSTITVSATNASGTVTSASSAIVISPAAAAPVFTASSPPSTGVVSTAYAGYTFTASGYPAPVFAVASGSLPAGLALNTSTGVLSGTPTTAGSSTFTISATNASGAVSSASRTITVIPAAAAPVFTADSPSVSGTVGTAYAGYTFTASGYPAPTFALATGSLPAGLSISSAGLLSGTPTTAGSSTFTISATNASGTAGSSSHTITVVPASVGPAFTASTPPSGGTVGTAFSSYTFTASGYPAPVFAVASGSLPAGLVLDAFTGVLSGTPTTAGASTFTVSATNAGGAVSSASRTITVVPAAAAPALTASSPPATGTVGTAYAGYTFTATGYPSATFAVATGSLPAGLVLSAGGGLSGTPSLAGSSTFTVSASNASGSVSSGALTITVSPAAAGPGFTASAPPLTGTVGTAYAGYTFTASGYPDPVFAVASGVLPDGLALSTAGGLSGTPTAAGSFSFTVSATNASGAVSTSSKTIVVSPVAAAPVFTASSPPVTGTVSTAYAGYTFTASGYPAPVFAVASGSLPTGLSLSGAGVLSGTPTAAGSSTFTVSAANASGSVSTSSLTLAISPAAAAPAFTTASPPATGVVGTAYAGYTFTASGYPAPVFAVAGGSLPAGLALDPFTGILSGTPTAAGSSSFMVSATNASGAVSTGAETVTVSPAAAAPAFTASSPPVTGTVGTVYAGYAFAASGYPAPVFAVASGSLPTGLTLSGAGALAGTPTSAGSFTFTVSATNASGTANASAVTIAIEPAAAIPAFTASSPPSTGTVGTAYAGYTFAASGYPAPSFAVASGSLPAGVSLDAFTGGLSGTPTTAGASSFTVSATNAGGAVSTASRSIVISPAAAAPVFTASSPPSTGVVSTAYAGYTFAASGYPAPAFAVASGALPPGLTLSGAGVLAGTPSSDGSFVFTVSATNASGTVSTSALTIVVTPAAAAPAFTASTPPATGTVGTAYAGYTFAASGYPVPVFAVASGALPDGLALDSVTGALAGTPTTAGTSSFTVSATNASGAVNAAAVSLVVSPAAAAPSFTASSPPLTGTVGTVYAGYTFAASGYPAPVFARVSGTLPTGLTLSSAGTLAGTPTAAGPFTFTVSATNASGTVNAGAVTVAIEPAAAVSVFTASSPPATGTVGTAYAGYTFTASGYPAPTFAVSAGSLPAGLSLDALTGVLSGTPTASGTSLFMVSATNAGGAVSTASRSIVVSPAAAAPVFTGSTPPAAGTVGTVYAGYTFAASGYPAPVFAVATGTLPTGLTLSSAGTLAGTPTAAGSFVFTVSATNAGGAVSTSALAISIEPAAAAPVFTAASPPSSGVVGTTYAGYTFAASGYPAPTFAVASGALPSGLALDPATGILSGTPTAAGTATFTVSATNAGGAVNSGSRTVTVVPAAAAPVLTASSPPLSGTVGTVYAGYTFTASGYPAPGFAVASGSLPAGLSLSAGGALSGTPSAAGSSTFTVSATNASGSVSSGSLTVVVSPAAAAPVFTASSPPLTGTVGTAYAGYTFTASGYPAPVFAVASGVLPDGLALSAAGGLSGTPSVAGSFGFTVSAANASGAVSTSSKTIVVSPAAAAPGFTAFSAPVTGTVGTAYAGYTFAASGYPAPVFARASGSLPTGLSLSSAGVLSGTPTAAGSFTFTVSATNAGGAASTGALTIAVDPAAAAPVFTAASPPATGTVGTAYAGYTFTASGFPAPTFAVTSGALPSGLALDAFTGVLSGTPTAAGSSTFTVSATNASGAVSTSAETIVVSPAAAAPVFTASSPPMAGSVSTTYAGYTFAASGYPAPVFARATGTLPTGLSLSSAGVLSGTPTAAGSFTFTVSATNASGTVSTGSLTIAIDPAAAAPVFTAASPPATGTVGTAYAGYTFTASGFPAPVFAVASGSLPGGLALDAFTGALSGTPTTAGSFTFSVSAGNAGGAVSTASRSIVISPAAAAPVFTNAAPTTATVGAPYSHTFTASGFPVPTFAVASGSLPSGLTLTSAGVLAGTPDPGSDAAYSITVTATNGVNPAATSAFTLTVDPAPIAPTAPVFTGADPAAATVGAAYSSTFTANAYPAATFTATGLPGWLSLSSAGVLSGTPTTAGPVSFTVTATNGVGTDPTRSVTLTVYPAAAAPSFTSGPPPVVTIGTGYSSTFTASGYPAPSFTTSDPLPAGLALSGSGVLSGTASTGTAGSYPITVTAANGVGSAATSAVTLVVVPAAAGPVFTSATPPSAGTVGTVYPAYTFAASGYPAPTFAVTSGVLPGGLSLNSVTGVLSGTPSTAGAFGFTVSAANATSTVSASPVTITISPAAAAPVFTSGTPGPATVGTAYSFSFTASGYPVPTFSTADPLPVGLSLSSGGVLAGTAATGTAGSYPITVTASNGSTATSVLTLVVVPAAAAPTFTVQPTPPDGTIGTAYSYTFVTAGYPAPTFALAGGSLPAGLMLNSGTGGLSGTPTGAAGTASFRIAAANATATVISAPIALTVHPAAAGPLFVNSSPGTATVGTPYSYQFTASGYPAAGFSTSDPLPVGLTLSSAGLLSGTAATGTAGSYPITVTAANGVGTAATSALTLVVVPAAAGPVFTSATPPSAGTVGTAYPAYAFVAAGHPAPTFTVTGGALPGGLSLDPVTGVLSGTPSTAGAFGFMVSAANATSAVSTGPVTITISPAAAAPAFTSGAPGPITVGTAYSFGFTASGYPAPTFSTADPLPVGLSLSSGGVLAGTAATGTAGSYPITVTAANGVNPAATSGLTLVVGPAAAAPSFTVPPVPPTATIGTAYSYTFVTAGYPAPTFALVGGALPAGLTLNSSTGGLSGTPTGAAGTAVFAIAATNATSSVTSGSISLTVNPAAAAPLFTSGPPAPATVGTAYSFSFAASGYPAPTFSTSDPLPVGLSLTSAGLLNGTPATGTAGSYPITVTATNGVGSPATSAVTVTVVPAAAAPVFTSAGPAGTGTVGTAYSAYTFVASGYPAATFAVASGSLPSGLTLNPSTGVLSGTPSAAGAFSFTVAAANATATVSAGPVTITISPAPAAPAFTSAAPASATVGTPYSFTFTASGHPAPTFSTADPLPVGLSLTSGGMLSGTPASSTAGSYPVTITATNGVGPAATSALTLVVVPAAAAPTFTVQPTPPDGTIGTAYSYTFVTAGYPAPTFAPAGGSLPAGLTLNSSTGGLSGTPTGAAGTATFTITATNPTSSVTSAPVSLTVNPAAAAPAFTSGSPATATVGTAYSFSFTASGYPAPTFSTSDPLPVGLSLTSAGLLNGTPATGTAGSYPITVTATNGVGSPATSAVTVIVVPAAAAPVFTASQPAVLGTVGTAFAAYTFTASGYPAPTFAVAGGALPAGLTLNSISGVLSGTPTTAGTAGFTVSAANASGTVSTPSRSVLITPPLTGTVFTSAAPGPATVGTAYSHTFTVSGFPASSFSTTDPLPVGLALTSGGVLSGTPATGTAGSYPITIHAGNGIGAPATSTFTLVVSPAAAAPSFGVQPVPPDGTIGTAYSYTFVTSGYPAPTFALASGTLPAGLTLNSSTGALSGTPTGTSGTATFTIAAGNATSTVSTAPIALTIHPAAAAPLFTGAAPAAATIGTGYSHTFTASGYPVPTFSTTDPLPVGLTLTSTGLLSGTPATGTAGSYPVTITAGNGVGAPAASVITFSVRPASAAPVFTVQPVPPTATIGTGYSYTFVTAGYPAPTFALVNGTLPAGLTLNPSTGALTGTPTGPAGPSTFSIEATNATSAITTAPITFTVDPAAAAPLFTSGPPAPATVGTPYAFTFTASGFPYPSFATADPLPVGLTLSSAGLLSGTPAPGTDRSYPVTITASNGVGPAAGTSITLTVDPVAAAPLFAGSLVPTATVGTAYTHSFGVTGFPVPTVTTADPLPAGLTLTAAGLLTGTATAGADGSYPITVTAANGVGTPATSTFTLVVDPAAAAPQFTGSTAPTVTIGSPYTYSFASTGFPVPTITTSSPLPVGLTLTSAGLLHGTAAGGTAGSYPITLTAANGVAPAAGATLTLVVVPASVAPAFPVTPAPPTATIGTAYSYTFAPTGYPLPTFALDTGSLPAGISLDPATGELSGTATGPAGDSTFSVAATNASGAVVSTDLTLTVNPVPSAPTFIATAPPGVTIGTPYSFGFAASGFPVPTFSSSDPLPVGLTLSPAGVLAGTAAGGTAGSYPVTVTAGNGVGAPATVSFGLTVTAAPAPPVLTAVRPPATGTVGAAYAGYTFAASGAPAPTFSVVQGSLPAGLNLNPVTGLLTGVPTTAGTTGFAIRAGNASATVTSANLTITVLPAPVSPTFTAATPPATGTVGTAYAYLFATTGFPLPTFAVSSGALPDGLTLDGDSGALTGVPTGAQRSMFRISATNSTGTATSSEITVVIGAAPVVAPTTTALSPPATVSLTAGRASLIASWPAVAGATSYVASAEPGEASCTTSGTSCVIGGVRGIPYTVTVVARDGVAQSAASPESAAATPGAPEVPPVVPVAAPATLTTDKGAIGLAAPGDQITAMGSGFAPYSSTTVIIYSSPIVLGTTTTDSAGAFSLLVTVPAGLESGAHTILASGVDESGISRQISLPVTIPDTTADSTGGSPPIPKGGHLTLLDGHGQAVSSVTVAEGTYSVTAAGLIDFVPVRGFVGTATAVGYRLTDAVGTEITGTYAAVVAPVAGVPAVPLAGSLVWSGGVTPRAAVPCTLSTGAISRCTVTASVLVAKKQVAIGRAVSTPSAATSVRKVVVAVPLSPAGQALATRPGGVRVRFTAVLAQRGLTATTTVQRTATVLAPTSKIPRPLYFTGDSSRLRPDNRSYLTSLLDRLRIGATAVHCTGHADTPGAAGSIQALARSRAQAACTFLAERLDIPMYTAGVAEKPLTGRENTPANRARHHRVDIIVHN